MSIDDADGIELPDLPELEPLRSSYMHFYLTGSYFFGCARPYFANDSIDWHDRMLGPSDIDFIAAKHGDMIHYLESNGFTKKTDFVSADNFEVLETYGLTGETIHVEHKTEAIYQRGLVQIQIVNSPAYKCRVRDIIKANHSAWHLDANKQDRTRLWHAYLTVLGLTGLHSLNDLKPDPSRHIEPITEL